MSDRKLKCASIQHSCTDDRESNLDRTISGIKDAASQGAELIVLQELHTSIYFCQTEDVDRFELAESIPGPTTDTLSEIASELKLVIITSIFERRASGIYHNTAVVIDKDGSIAGMYRKMHIPDDPSYYEKFYFTPGDLDFHPVQTSIGKLGILICWDQWFPEAARLMSLAGAELLIYPTAIGWDPSDDEAEKQRQLDAWKIVQRGHAIANGIPVLCCNRSGFEADNRGNGEGIQFWGNSFMAGPQGEILNQADKNDTVLVTDIDLSRSENIRRIWPFLRDRRIDAYDDLLQSYRS